ncbi:MAG: hypothetical protein COW54_07890 [Rhodobacteraceae bacterium CG17_big_fil_post_rev_8_21_14_2_50_63_15]|nr:MAG: hypothetical protein COW54_07890 [Rhodobacteraceae bacterium CG17_big_fil_post_rev_8_21_14_2_50_63_15]
MDIWNVLEYVAWGASVLFGFFILYDWFVTNSRYSEEVLTSSREGELEAMTEDQRN